MIMKSNIFLVKKAVGSYDISLLDKGYAPTKSWFKERKIENEVGHIRAEYFEEKFLSDKLNFLKDYLIIVEAFVDKPLIGRGYGKKLYQKSLQFAKSKGFKGIVSEKRNRNELSDRFWKNTDLKCGFNIISC